LKEVRYAVVILVMGLLLYFFFAWKRKEWPFAVPELESAQRAISANG
jgi:hypothetical protein